MFLKMPVWYLCFFTMFMLAGLPAVADEDEIVADIRAFFESADGDRRAELIERIESDPDYDRKKVGSWLHLAVRFDAHKPGVVQLAVPIDHGRTRTVYLRIPKAYDHTRPWPLIVAYHGGGDTAEHFITSLEEVFGEKMDEYVVAAPNEYRSTAIDLFGPPSVEHPMIWHAVKQKLHVDSDRVFLLGYSLGGYATWTYTVTHADQFAGAVPLACAFSMPREGWLWKAFLDNFAHVRVLHVWGERDRMPVPGFGGRQSLYYIAPLNHEFAVLSRKRDLNVITYEVPQSGHQGVRPPPRALASLLSGERIHYPSDVNHTFRHLFQAVAYWLEGHTWVGGRWDDALQREVMHRFDGAPGPIDEEAVAESVRARLGRLKGHISGQRIAVQRTHIGELTIWLGEDMIDWNKPVTVSVDGRVVFDGTMEPDLHVCLAQAARTYDFERLRWAGLRVSEELEATPVTGTTEFPALLDIK